MAGEMTEALRPQVIVIAGPNGAGKSTTAPALVRDLFGVVEFVNADLIAQGLSAFDTEAVAFQAGKVMLRRLHQLASQQKDFAFETTLSTRSYAPWLADMEERGYEVNLVFLWLPSPAVAIARVAERVRLGGHNVPEAVVRRRYARGLANFFHLYLPIVSRWWFFDNSPAEGPRLLASGKRSRLPDVEDKQSWETIKERYQ